MSKKRRQPARVLSFLELNGIQTGRHLAAVEAPEIPRAWPASPSP
jgi:hypothetical protein